MKVVQASIRYPVSTAVGVILLVLFGLISAFRLPIQLTPDVEQPVITVSTVWSGASPQEIERDIIDEQEEQLKSLEGLDRMRSQSRDSEGEVSLHFKVGEDKDAATLRIANKLEQVPEYPVDAEKPVIEGEGGADNAVAWFSLLPTKEDGFEGDISALHDFVDDHIVPELERVPGVASVNIFGGREREIQVIVDPAKLALRQVTITELAEAIERENRNYSGGDFDEGKRRYVVRTVGEYRSPEDIENIVVAVRNDVPIYLRDVAEAKLGLRKSDGGIFSLEGRILALNMHKQAGANVMEIMAEIDRRVDRLNRDVLGPRGLELDNAWDQTSYIESAIGLVRSNLLIGGMLAVIVLLLFLRSASSTLIVTLAIPIAIIGTFLLMGVFGRTINVISLAGLAFATGMVVDNSIVVLENIYRHRQMGKDMWDAAHDGASEVWGAVLASTLTTIAVFAPVVFIQEEVGQLFGDIAIALSCAVALSLIISITVIPALSARYLRTSEEAHDDGFHRLWGGVALAQRAAAWIVATVARINASMPRRLAVVFGGTAAAIIVSLLLMPKAEYLPKGDTDYLFGLILPPPGYSIAEQEGLSGNFVRALGAYSRRNQPPEDALPGGGIGDYFFGIWGSICFVGMSANDPTRIRELIPPFRQAASAIPGAIAFIDQWGIFDETTGGGRQIDVEIRGPDLNQIIDLGREVFMGVFQHLPGAQGFPRPSLDLGNPEVQVQIDRQRAAELGISNRDLGFTVSALVDGIKVSDYQYEGREIDLKLMAEQGFAHRTHLLEQMPIATPDGRLVTLGSVARLAEVNGPLQINHRERQRTITIEVTPTEEMPLETAIEIINEKILEPMRAAGKIGGLYDVYLSGSADKLEQAGVTLRFNLLLALAITYLLMAALFESFLYPFVIMFSVPLAALGGFIGLAVVNLLIGYQPMDVLTMLGFIILIGTVVNNAILIVHQALSYMRGEGMAPEAAVIESVRTRIRPIFMSVGTSTLAMLPLVVAPGAGSELYRGLGAVVIGGLVISTVFTLFIVPAMLSLVLDLRGALASRLGGRLGIGGDPQLNDGPRRGS
jgi:HAE1 family hydrophobic/amphiphilic exporter-1